VRTKTIHVNTSDGLRLCRLMCGKAMPFRDDLVEMKEALPPDFCEALASLKKRLYGKAKPSRTSGGTATIRS
jgi:hypothetical protein